MTSEATVEVSRLEALVIARASTLGAAQPLGELIKPLARFAPPELTAGAWRDRLVTVAGTLRASDVLDAGHQLRDAGELGRRIGRVTARTWRELADRVLPGLALGIAADDGTLRARLAGRDAWAAAIVGRALGLWTAGAPPSLAALCDALAWRELALAGKPKRCPPEIRAVFVQRQLGSEAGPPERLVRILASREVGAPRPELRALCDALVRDWLAGRTIGSPVTSGARTPPASAPDPAGSTPAEARSLAADLGSPPGDAPRAFAADLGSTSGGGPRSFLADVQRAAGSTATGRFGDRKVFVSAVWDELRRDPWWAAVTLDELKARLVAAHRAGELALARADLVAAMDPALVAASEITTDGASFHFIVTEPVVVTEPVA